MRRVWRDTSTMILAVGSLLSVVLAVIATESDLQRDAAWLEREFDLYVLGEAIYDQFMSFSTEEEEANLAALLHELDLTVGGGCLINEAQVQSINDRYRPFYTAAGGAACNTCAGVSLMGGRTIFSGVITNDQLGTAYAQDMSNYPNVKVHLRVLDSSDTQHTGTVFALLNAAGERTMPAYPGVAVLANYPTDVVDVELAASKIVFVEGYLWAADDNWQMMDRLFEQARSYGVHTALTYGDVWICKSRREQLRAITANTDIIFSDVEQMATLLEVDPNDLSTLAIAVQQAIGRLAVVTQGSKGALVITRDGDVIQIPVVPVEQSAIVDTTGAGDQFAAGFLYGYARGYSLYECGTLGAQAASRILVQVGSKPLPRLTPLDNLDILL